MSALVGAAEAAQILGTNAPQITRWRKAEQVLPPRVADLKATPVWHRRHIEQLAQARAAGEVPEYDALLHEEVVGLAEATFLIGCEKSSVGRWRRAGRFPEPCADLAAGPIWRRATIITFASERLIAAV